VSQQFFMRQLEKRTFELYQTAGRRAVFADETPRGATWDELQLLNMLSGNELSAEAKGKPFKPFQSVAAITIVGNHKPTSSPASRKAASFAACCC
jgi:phage/plasmid-associated DNA primase